MSERDRTLWFVAPLACGAIGLVLLLIVGFVSAASVMPAYLAGWLFWLSVPVGALAAVMTLELVGYGTGAAAAALRPLLILLPLAALFGLPVLLRLPALYGWAGTPLHGFAGAWFGAGFFVVRSVIYLIVWSLLALAFMRPHRFRDRQGLAGFGLAIHLVIGSLAATDWAMSIDPGLDSSLFGLDVIVGQASLAVAAALLLNAAWLTPLALRRFAWLMVAALAASGFLHFAEYLTVWSADLPGEIVWYQQRGGLGALVPWFGLAVVVVGIVLLMPIRLSSLNWLVAVLAGLVVLAQGLGMMWLITPSFGRPSSLILADALAVLGIGGIMVALFGRTSGRARGAAVMALPERYVMGVSDGRV